MSAPPPHDEEYRRRFRSLYAFFKVQGVPEHVCPDLAQDTFVRIQKAGRDPVQVTPSYLWRAARSVLLDYWRNPQRRIPTATPYTLHQETGEEVPVEVPDPAPSPDDVIILKEKLQKALHQLTDKERTVVWLRLAEGLSAQEVADVLGITANNVDQILFRAKDKLQKLLLEQTEDASSSKRSRAQGV